MGLLSLLAAAFYDHPWIMIGIAGAAIAIGVWRRKIRHGFK